MNWSDKNGNNKGSSFSLLLFFPLYTHPLFSLTFSLLASLFPVGIVINCFKRWMPCLWFSYQFLGFLPSQCHDLGVHPNHQVFYFNPLLCSFLSFASFSFSFLFTSIFTSIFHFILFNFNIFIFLYLFVLLLLYASKLITFFSHETSQQGFVQRRQARNTCETSRSILLSCFVSFFFFSFIYYLLFGRVRDQQKIFKMNGEGERCKKTNYASGWYWR